MGVSEFRAALVAAGLGEFADKLASMVEPGVRLVPVAADDSALPLGGTKMGGSPDLPPAIAWPEFRGRPQSFVAQVNLADLADLPGASRLPSSGLLSFFFDSTQQAWGGDPEHRGGCRVLYAPASAPLERTPPPAALADGSRFSSRRIRAEPIVTYPDPECSDVALAVPELDIGRQGASATTWAQAGAYASVYDAFEPVGSGRLNRLLGHPVSMQMGLQMDAQLAYHGVPPFDPSAPPDPRRELLRPGASCWRLLLQIDLDEFEWGHYDGRMFFLIRDVDLARHDFGHCWPTLQCD